MQEDYCWNINWSQCFTRKYNLLFCEGSRNVWKILALNGKTFTSSSKAKACLDVLCRLYCCQCECCIASRSLWKKNCRGWKWKSGDWWCCLPLSETSLITCCVLRLVAVSILRLGLAAFFHCWEMKCSSNIHRLTDFLNQHWLFSILSGSLKICRLLQYYYC